MLASNEFLSIKVFGFNCYIICAFVGQYNKQGMNISIYDNLFITAYIYEMHEKIQIFLLQGFNNIYKNID